MFLFQVMITAKSDSTLYAALAGKNEAEALRNIGILRNDLKGSPAALRLLDNIQTLIEAESWTSAQKKAEELKPEIAKAKMNQPTKREGFTITLETANDKFSKGKWKEAADEYKALLDGNKLAGNGLKTAQMNLAQSYFKLGNYKGAVDAYTAAIDGGKLSQKELAAAKFVRGNAYYDMKENEKALADFTGAIESKAYDGTNDMPNLLYDRGLAYFYLGKYEEAKADHGKAQGLYAEKADKDDCASQIKKCDEEIAKKKPEETLTAKQWSDKAMGCWKTSPEEALKYINKAIGLDPSNAGYYSSRGSLNLQMGKNQEALDDYNKAIGFDPELGKNEAISACIATVKARLSQPAESTPTLVPRTSIALADLGLGKYYNDVDNKFAADSGYDKDALLAKVLDYAKDNVKGFGDWRDGIEGWSGDEGRMALIKSMYLLAFGRGLGNMTASLDRVGDVDSVVDAGDMLQALWNGTESKVSGAMTATTKGTTGISDKQKSWWASNFSEIITQDILKGVADKKEALRKEEEKKKLAQNVEQPGTADAYTSLDAFKSDWRVSSAAGILGGNVDYETFKDAATGKYMVASAVAAAKKKVDGTEKKENPVRNAACDAIEAIVGAAKEMPDNSVQLTGGIDNGAALDIAVQSGIFYRGNARADVRNAARKDDQRVGGEVFEFDGKFYALAASAKTIANVPDELKRRVGADGSGMDANVKAVGRAMASKPLEIPAVQDALRMSLQKDLEVLKVVDASGNRLVNFEADATNKAITDYFTNKKSPPDIRLQLAGIALASRQVAVEKSMRTAEELAMGEPAVLAAINAKCANAADRNAEALLVLKYLNDNAGKLSLKDALGNFSKDKALDAINNKYKVTAVEKKKEEEKKAPAPVVAITREAYDKLDVAGKKHAIGDFVTSQTDADWEKAQEAVSGKNKKMDNGKIEDNLKYLVSLTSDKIFEDNGSKMSARKIVLELDAHEKELEAANAPAGGKASMPELYKFIAANRDKIDEELLKNKINNAQIDKAAADAIMNEFVAWASTATDPIIIDIIRQISTVEELAGRAIKHYELSK
ncbi:MAG: tetratricopeptide repeat protein [Candidatus Micrarchaeota archaeon]|nr:tetratricopeptide repeat protein [Candidatus Micrarchaeota archaeon]